MSYSEVFDRELCMHVIPEWVKFGDRYGEMRSSYLDRVFGPKEGLSVRRRMARQWHGGIVAVVVSNSKEFSSFVAGVAKWEACRSHMKVVRYSSVLRFEGQVDAVVSLHPLESWGDNVQRQLVARISDGALIVAGDRRRYRDELFGVRELESALRTKPSVGGVKVIDKHRQKRERLSTYLPEGHTPGDVMMSRPALTLDEVHALPSGSIVLVEERRKFSVWRSVGDGDFVWHAGDVGGQASAELPLIYRTAVCLKRGPEADVRDAGSAMEPVPSQQADSKPLMDAGEMSRAGWSSYEL